MRLPQLAQLLFLLGVTIGPAGAAEFPGLIADRIVVERVYYMHRLGEKPPFDQTLPHHTAEKLVRLDLHKEAVLRHHYKVEVGPEMLHSELQRINSTTRAPEVLAELKAALGNDADRISRTLVKPIVVERLLRAKFENDDSLHASLRRQIESTRQQLLSAKKHGAGFNQLLEKLKQDHAGKVHETTWHLSAPPAISDAEKSQDELDIRERFGPGAQVLSSLASEDPTGSRLYFSDLPTDLQAVLRAQLLNPGDISAVIEAPSAFLLYLAKTKTTEILTVAEFSIPKLNYEVWLDEQPEDKGGS